MEKNKSKITETVEATKTRWVVYNSELKPLHIGIGIGVIGASCLTSIILNKYLKSEEFKESTKNSPVESLVPVARAACIALPVVTSGFVLSSFLDYERTRVAKPEYNFNIKIDDNEDLIDLFDL